MSRRVLTVDRYKEIERLLAAGRGVREITRALKCWLERMARGVYCRPNDPPALHPSVALLQRGLEGLHVGGKSALDWHGIRHYVALRPILHLFGWNAGRLPHWFTERFPAQYHRKRLFEERPDALLHVRPFENRKGAPLVSAPERALLELLSEVGIRHLDTARLLTRIAPLVLIDDTFALKGGTAINLFVRDMPRLSVDLDLVLPDCTLPREQALKRINDAIRQSGARLKKQGFQTQAPTSADAGETKLLVRQGAIQVKIEVNFVMRGTVHRKRVVPAALPPRGCLGDDMPRCA